MGTVYERAGVMHGDGMSMAEKVKRLGPLPLVHDPGQCWTYGPSSDVAGRLIEVVLSQSLDRYLTRCVFDPVGMKCTYFVVPAEQRARLVPAHARDGDKLVVPPWSRDGGPRYLSGGGGLHTTVGDYSRFVQLLLGGCVSVVSRESINSMTRNQIGDLTTPFGFKYGLSLGIATSEVSGTSPLPVGGVGWYGIYSTWFWTLPRRRAAVLFFGNVLAPGMNLPLFARLAAAIDAAMG